MEIGALDFYTTFDTIGIKKFKSWHIAEIHCFLVQMSQRKGDPVSIVSIIMRLFNVFKHRVKTTLTNLQSYPVQFCV